MMAPVFRWPVRVYYEDTDAGGVVYHANYVRYFERVRTEWLRASGVAQSELRTAPGLMMAVRAMQLEFLRPARLDDALVASIDSIEWRPASLRMTQQLRRESDASLLASASVRIACVDNDFKPRAMPEDLLAELRARWEPN